MTKNLHTIIKESTKRGLPLRALAWLDDQPMWITPVMSVLGDPQLKAHFGEYQLRHFQEQLSSLGEEYVIGSQAVGCYPLEISGTHLHLNAPQKPRQWDGFRNISFSMISEMVEEAKKGLGAVCAGISNQKSVKEKVYRFGLKEKDTSSLIPNSTYLPQNQVDYIKNLYPLNELSITIRQSGVYFKRENFLAGIGMLNPGLFKS